MLKVHCHKWSLRAHLCALLQAERAQPKPTAATLHRAAQGAASRPASAASGSGARGSASRRTATTARRPAKRRARESSVSSLDDEGEDEDEDLELSSDTVCLARMALPAA